MLFHYPKIVQSFEAEGRGVFPFCERGLNYGVGGDYNCKGYGAAADGRSKKMLSINYKTCS